MDERLKHFNEKKRVFETFLKYTDQKKCGIDFLIKSIPKTEKKLRVLSVGAGLGEDVWDILLNLKNKKTKFEFFYNDPSRISFDYFFKKAKRLGLSRNISGKRISTLDSLKLNEKFDFILVSHVFYYINDWREALKKINNLLSREGVACLVLQSKHGNHYKLRSKFIPGLQKKEYYERYGEEIIDVVDKLRIKTRAKRITFHINMAPALMENGRVSATGIKILSFLLRYDYNKIDKKTRKEINEFIIKKVRKEVDNSILYSSDLYILFQKNG